MESSVKQAFSGSADELFDALSALDRACVGAEGWSAASFRSEAEKDCGIVLYIQGEGGAVAGLLCGYYAVGEGDITSVAVAPEHRRKGLALRLMNEFEELLPDDTESIFLEVRESNEAAKMLYKKCGFEEISLRKHFYSEPDEAAVVMKKFLK